MNAGAQRAHRYDSKAVSLAGLSMRSPESAIGRCRSTARRSTTPAARDARCAKTARRGGIGAMQAMMYASALWFGAFDGIDVDA